MMSTCLIDQFSAYRHRHTETQTDRHQTKTLATPFTAIIISFGRHHRKFTVVVFKQSPNDSCCVSALHTHFTLKTVSN